MPSTTQATGPFDVKLSPLGIHEGAANDQLGRMSIEKTFRGDLEGNGRGEMLTGGGSVKGSAVYVAIERVEGTLHGRRGSFILQHRGVMNRGVPELSVTVAPDSGTGELAGIVGHMVIDISDGVHTYRFDYTLGAVD